MFDSDILAELTRSHRQTLHKLHEVEQNLTARFVNLKDPIRALILAVAAGEPLLLVGPPGTAKSRLIRAFCGLTGLIDEQSHDRRHDAYFEYLLTPFTEPGELFGFYDISKLDRGELTRLEKGMMQNATVVYLDEVFNGSSAILNSLLAFMNEGIFHDRGEIRRVNMKCLFAATNQIPETAELRAVYDRFVLRCEVNNVASDVSKLAELVHVGWQETYRRPLDAGSYYTLLNELEALRNDIKSLTEQGRLRPAIEHPFYNSLTQIVEHAREYDLSAMSNRRLIKIIHIMLIHRLYEAAIAVEPPVSIVMRAEELQLIPRFFLDRNESDPVERMMRVAIRYD